MEVSRPKPGCAIDPGRGVAVLVQLPDNPITPYVTWRRDVEGNTYWGHYFKSFDEAYADYHQRCRELNHLSRGGIDCGCGDALGSNAFCLQHGEHA